MGGNALSEGGFQRLLEKAPEAFIEVMERDKAYDNEGAKVACKAISQLLGRRHPLVQRFFRRFSSALRA